MASVTSQLTEEVTAHEQSDSLEDAREVCADGIYFPNNLHYIKTDVKGVEWFHVTQDRIQWRAVVNTVMDIWVP